MTPEQRLEQLLEQLAELKRYDFSSSYGDCLTTTDPEGSYVEWDDIEAIIKQNFPDDEFH